MHVREALEMLDILLVRTGPADSCCESLMGFGSNSESAVVQSDRDLNASNIGSEIIYPINIAKKKPCIFYWKMSYGLNYVTWKVYIACNVSANEFKPNHLAGHDSDLVVDSDSLARDSVSKFSRVGPRELAYQTERSRKSPSRITAIKRRKNPIFLVQLPSNESE